MGPVAVNLITALAVFGVILPAELPDKTMIACVALGSRFPPRLVWCGMALAFAVHVTIAVTAGGLLSLAPHWLVGSVAAAMLVGGAVVLWRAPFPVEPAPEVRAGPDGPSDPAGESPLRVIGTGFVVVFVAEWGDLTQILTATLAARYHDPLSVAVGATAALWTVAALGIVAGVTLLRVVPIRLLRRIAASALLVLAAATVIQTVR